MAKIGVITDGISRELEHALTVMNEYGLDQAELQYIWGKEVGDLSNVEINQVRNLAQAHKVEVSCISRHIFGGISIGDIETDSPIYLTQIEALRRCIEMAKALDCSLVRTMSFRKEMILFGRYGADQWNVSTGAWDKLVHLMVLPVEIAEEEGITLVVETGNNAMISSAYFGRKLIEALGTSRLKVLWDPCNSLYCNETAYPDGYEALKGGYLGHLHLKDSEIDIPKATVVCRSLGEGHLGPSLEAIENSLRGDNYDGVISLESVYRPEGGSFEDGFRSSIEKFKSLFD